MNKKVISVGALGIILVLGGAWFLSREYPRSDDVRVATPSTDMEKDGVEVVDTRIAMEKDSMEESVPSADIEVGGVEEVVPSVDMEVDGVGMIEGLKEYTHQGILEDVTQDVVRGVDTARRASGEVRSWYHDDDVYELRAVFNALPDPVGDDFYEGWLVQKIPFNVISTGAAVKIKGVYVNDFALDEDLTGYSRYVLTLEPNDGDPAPAEHIVEGDIQEL